MAAWVPAAAAPVLRGIRGPPPSSQSRLKAILQDRIELAPVGFQDSNHLQEQQTPSSSEERLVVSNGRLVSSHLCLARASLGRRQPARADLQLLVSRGLWIPRGLPGQADRAELRCACVPGGCGAMYEVHIESEDFKAKRPVQQHQMVNQALKEEIKGMHGLRIFTSVPKR
ncbi:bolA-like protein 3 [Echinops telfairi]|uniref:BolA-like protein 3 n=1 Tax=Echinops telfairi TaxID=9371 RepID=A0AC55CSP5_ECHTE|nr:bolA-like protein 3 [Echinops telfairi]